MEGRGRGLGGIHCWGSGKEPDFRHGSKLPSENTTSPECLQECLSLSPVQPKLLAATCTGNRKVTVMCLSPDL